MTIVKNRDYTGRSFRNADGSGYTFIECKFDRCDLDHTLFRDAVFVDCSFQKVSWNQADLENVKFLASIEDSSEADLEGVELEIGCTDTCDADSVCGWSCSNIKDIQSISASGMVMTMASFCNSNLKNALFVGRESELVSITDCNFDHADLNAVDFKYCDLSYSSFSGALFNLVSASGKKAKGTCFNTGTILDFCDFSNTNLANILFQGCKSMEAVNLSGADLNNATFTGKEDERIYLYRACFDDSKLTNASFSRCNLTSSSFRNADLDQVTIDKEVEKVSCATVARAVVFESASMSGFNVNSRIRHDFSGAVFSNVFLAGVYDGEVEETPPASLINTKLMGAKFDGAFLSGVQLCRSDLRESDFQSATFDGGLEDGGTFSDIDFSDCNFSNVALAHYSFVNCILANTCFESSDLHSAVFNWDRDSIVLLRDSKDGSVEKITSFSDQFMLRASFVDADLTEAKFELKSGKELGMRYADFTRSVLAESIFENVDLSYAGFDRSVLTGAQFVDSKMHYCTFEQVYADRCQLNQSDIEYSSFRRCTFKRFEATTGSLDTGVKGVSFDQTRVAGRMEIKLNSCSLNNTTLDLSETSKLTFHLGSNITNSAIFLVGKSELVFEKGIVENSTIETKNSIEGQVVLFKDATISSSSLIGMSSCWELEEVSMDRNSVRTGWKSAKFSNPIFNTTIFHELDDDADLRKQDWLSDPADLQLAFALRVNAKSLGQDKLCDELFAIEKELKLKKDTEKPYLLGLGVLFSCIFLLVLPFVDIGCFGCNKQLYWAIYVATFAASVGFLYFSAERFLFLISGFGDLKRISVSSFVFIFMFSISYLGFLYKENKCINVENFFTATHISANSFFALGYWGTPSIFQPNDLMFRLYINLESAVGVMMLALFVAALIRKTMAR